MDAIEWLLEPSDPSVRYRTLSELLDRGETAETQAAQRAIPESAPVRKLLDAMQPDGYWLQKNNRTGQNLGDGVEYGSFGTTHFCLSYCAELGLTRLRPLIAKAAERDLSLQKEDGGWWRHFSCLYGYNIRTFIKLGYRDDVRVQKAIDLMLRTHRSDGGYLCDNHEKPNRKQPKSCVCGSVKALLAFAELPEYWGHVRCLELVDYFLSRNGIYKKGDSSQFVNNDMNRNTYPIVWRTSVWEVIYALSKMGYGRDKRLADAWDELNSHSTAEGRFKLDWTPALCPWKVGKTGEQNKWITFYCLLAKKYAGYDITTVCQ